MKSISSSERLLRRLFLFLIALLLIGVLSSCSLLTDANYASPAKTEDESEGGVTQLYCDIVFSSGLFSAKYDADLFINDEKIGTVPYGGRFTKLIDLEPGEYSLVFRSANNPEIMSSVEKINFKKNTTFACTLKAEKDAVKISDKKLSSGLIGAHLEMPDLSYSLLDDAENALKKTGFVNVVSQSNNGKSIINSSNWLVLSQSVSASTTIDKNDPIILTCAKKEDLIVEWFSGTNMLTADPVAKQYGYTLSFINSVSKKNLDPNDFSDDEKALWRVGALTDQSGKSAKLTVLYTGSVTMPNVIGQVLSDAVNSLQALNMSSIKEQTDSGSVWDRDNWFVIEQSVRPDQSIAADDTVILYCSKNAEQKRSAFNIPVPLEAIILKDDSSTVDIGDSFDVAFDLSPADATDVNLQYEYDSERLSRNGNTFTALKDGNTVIRIKQSDSIYADYAVEIHYVDVESITIDEAISLDIGSSYVPNISIVPDNATNKTYVMESDNPEIVSVEGDTITGLAEGQATLTVTCENGKTASVSVDVLSVPLRSMSFGNDDDLSLNIGTKQKLNFVFSPLNVTHGEFTWNSSDSNVVSVDSEGNIDCKAVGTAVITVTHVASQTTIEKKIEVLPIPLRSMVFKNDGDLSLIIGTKQKLDFDFSPANVTYSDFTWKSSNSKVVSVDSEGNIDCKAVGTAVITLTHVASQTTIEKKIEVLPIKVTGISVSGSKSTLTVGDSVKLKATVSPGNATKKSVSWKSSNTKVATVSTDGTVKAVGAGSATITCSSADGPSAKYSITVKGKPVTMKVTFSASCSTNNHVGNNWSKAFFINGKKVSSSTTITVAAGETVTFKAQITENDKYPDIGSGSVKVTFSSSDIQKGFTKSWKVTVKEGNGKYSGNTATWTITLKVSR